MRDFRRTEDEDEKLPTYQGPEDKPLEEPYVDPLNAAQFVATGGLGALSQQGAKAAIMNMAKNKAQKEASSQAQKLITGQERLDKLAGLLKNKGSTEAQGSVAAPSALNYSKEALREQMIKNRKFDRADKTQAYQNSLAEQSPGSALPDQMALLAAIRRLRGEEEPQ